MLLSLGLELPKTIFIHGYITSNGQKMSKSLGNTVDPFSLIEKYGADALRYFLLSEITPTEDGDFTEEKFKERYNADLANGIGNFTSRVLKLADKFGVKKISSESEFKNGLEKQKEKYFKLLEEFKLNEAMFNLCNIVNFFDKYIENEKPWETGDKNVVENLLFALEGIVDMLKPILPETAEKIKKQLKSKNPTPIFPRIK
jgi:methionyl-tRNA synthetase